VVKRRATPLRQGMQDVDCVIHVQSLAEPTGTRRPRSEPKALRGVTSTESPGGITGHRGRHWHLRQRVAIGPPELWMGVVG